VFFYRRGVLPHPFQGEIWQVGVLLTIPLLLLYSGEKGGDGAFHKWVFYWFYPLHFLVLVFVKTALA
jgi:hypothetical protein